MNVPGLRLRIDLWRYCWLSSATFLAILLLATSLGCGPAASEDKPAKRQVLVGAAADLQLAFGEVAEAFSDKTGHKVVLTFGSTGNLAKQIENGAPIDVFAAADTSFVEQLRVKGLVLPDTIRVYAIGRLVLASNKNAKLTVDRLEDLLRPEVKRIAIANPDHAPYGRAAKEALTSAGLWSQVEPKLVYGGNVQQTLQLVQTGNAEAGLVALSIANVPEVGFKVVDASLHAPIKQSIAVVKDTGNETVARQFVGFVCSPEGQAILAKYGYVSPGNS